MIRTLFTEKKTISNKFADYTIAVSNSDNNFT